MVLPHDHFTRCSTTSQRERFSRKSSGIIERRIDLSKFIEDEQIKPNGYRQATRWVLVPIMLYCVYLIGQGLYGLKHGNAVNSIWHMIAGTFFFMICYAAHWLLRDS